MRSGQGGVAKEGVLRLRVQGTLVVHQVKKGGEGRVLCKENGKHKGPEAETQWHPGGTAGTVNNQISHG